MWSDKQQQAIEKLKHQLIIGAVMCYFDSKKATELIVDPGPVGLGAILAQKDAHNSEPRRVVAYASPALTDVEQRYSQNRTRSP